MPTYDYACIECDETLEVVRGYHDRESIPPCPKCGYGMARVYNAPGIQFKGSGFYSTGG
jgi:putative FmdB family regulatory protein